MEEMVVFLGVTMLTKGVDTLPPSRYTLVSRAIKRRRKETTMIGGTDKQNEYAVTVKAKAIEGVKSYNREAFAKFERFAAEKPERAGESAQAKANHEQYQVWLEANEDALFWLDNKDATAQEWLKITRAAIA